VEQVARQFTEQAKTAGLDVRGGNPEPGVVEKGLLLGFADHLGVRRDRGTRRCELVHGRSGDLRRDSVVDGTGLLVGADLEEVTRGKQVQLLIGMATRIEMDWLEALFPGQFVEERVTDWDDSGRRLVGKVRKRFRDLVIEEQETQEVELEGAATLLAKAIIEGKLTLKKWGAEVERWIDRVNFLAANIPDAGFNRIGPEERQTLLETLCHGYRSGREIRELDPWPVLETWLPGGMRNWMDHMAPEAIELPNRRRPVRIRYRAPREAPILAATIQDLYDVEPETLFILEGKYPLKLEVLGPNRNPVQVLMADALADFWETSYPAIRKELKGRYPKHEWR
jgi:ATP-dependent helicase HrpB